MEFKDRQGENLNRKRLEIIRQTPTQLIVDVFSAASNVTEYGTPINAETLTMLQDELNVNLARLETLIKDKGATVTIAGEKVADVEFASDPQEQLNSKLNRNELLDLIYPVGAVYISVNDTNPSILFGGIWEEFALGRTIIGCGTSDNLYTSGDVGGESRHKLTLNEIPCHTHTCSPTGSGETTFQVISNSSGAELTASGSLSYSSNEKLGNVSSDGTMQSLNNINLNISNHMHSIGTVGADFSHNNLPPYVVCYIWKRIA